MKKRQTKTQQPEGMFEISNGKHIPKSKIESLIPVIVYDEKHGYYKAQDFTNVRLMNHEDEYYKKLATQTMKNGKFAPIVNSLNRGINRAFVRKIKKAFIQAKDSTLTTIVLAYTNLFSKNGEYELVVIDGQHRIIAFNELLEMYLFKVKQFETNPEKYEHPGDFDYSLVFKVVQISTIDQFVNLIVTLNSVSHNFKEENYIHTYSALGVPAYRMMAVLKNELEQDILPKLKQKFGAFPIELLKHSSSLTIPSAIRSGEAEFDYDEAKQNVLMMIQLMTAVNITSVRPGRPILELVKSEGYKKNHNGFIKYLNALPEGTKKRSFKEDEKEMKQKLHFHYKAYLSGRD